MGTRVLFAEDEGAIRSIVGEPLREEGFEVVEAESGDEAACVLDKQNFDFLLTDVRMPGSRDGLDLAAYARRKDPNLAVVVINGYAAQVEARIRVLGGRVTLLSKPFRLLEVLAALGGARSGASRSAWRLTSPEVHSWACRRRTT